MGPNDGAAPDGAGTRTTSGTTSDGVAVRKVETIAVSTAATCDSTDASATTYVTADGGTAVTVSDSCDAAAADTASTRGTIAAGGACVSTTADTGCAEGLRCSKTISKRPDVDDVTSGETCADEGGCGVITTIDAGGSDEVVCASAVLSATLLAIVTFANEL